MSRYGQRTRVGQAVSTWGRSAPLPLNVDYLVVAGGAGGGNNAATGYSAGGGGAAD